MKLVTGSLKGKVWDEVLPEEDHMVWKEILKGYVDSPRRLVLLSSSCKLKDE